MFCSGIQKEDAKLIGVELLNKGNDTTAAHAGKVWEKKAAGILRDKGILVEKESIEGDSEFSVEETLDVIRETTEKVRTDGITRYIYQPVLKVTNSFCNENLHLNEELMTENNSFLKLKLSSPKPDLIRLSRNSDGEVIASVADIKLAKRMKAEHKAQVSLYIRYLYHEIMEERIPVTVNCEYGYLWNYGQDMEKEFKNTDINDVLESFLEDIFPDVLNSFYESILDHTEKKFVDSLDICIGNMCEYCDNYVQCYKKAKEIHSVQLIPYLSPFAQNYLKKLDLPLDVESFSDKLNDECIFSSLKANLSWKRILNDRTVIDVHKSSFEDDGNVNNIWKNAFTFSMPPRQDEIIILTAQKDIGTDCIYAAGFQSSFDEDRESYVFIANSRTDDEITRNSLAFARKLYEHLEKTEEYNDKDDLYIRVQAYVMDGYELSNLQEMLFNLLLEHELSDNDRNAVMGLLFWLQGERLVTDLDEQPENALAYPVSIICSELRKLVVLPLHRNYSLLDIRKTLLISIDDKDMKFITKDGDYDFFGRSSDMIPSRLINEYWDGKDKSLPERYTKHLKKRFLYEEKIIKRLQSKHFFGKAEDATVDDHLLARLSPFKLPGKCSYTYSLLSKWYYIVKYENLLQSHRIRQNRQQDFDIALENGNILELEYIDSKIENGDYKIEFKAINAERISHEWFCGLIFWKFNFDSIKAAYRFDDYSYSSISDLYKIGDKIAPLSFIEYKYKNDGVFLTGKTTEAHYEIINKLCSVCGREGSQDIPGSAFFYLSERFTDMNSWKLLGKMTTNGYIPGILDVLHNEYKKNGKPPMLTEPVRIQHKIIEDHPIDKDKLLSYSCMDGYSFTASQKKAFLHFADNSLTVLQGPPGTGKTDFIARTVVSLCRYYKEERGKSLKVLVSSNTNIAIMNVLQAVRNKLSDNDDIKIVKISSESSNETKKEGIDNKDAKKYSPDPSKPTVLGATCWKCHDLKQQFDIVIIDEASQVRAVDSMLILNTGVKEACRYLLVGDDDQLPPILLGCYKQNKDEPYLYGSIFRFFTDKCREGNIENCCLRLDECFRMNEVLLRYSAEKIYDMNYRAYNEKIARNHLDYAEYESVADDWVLYALDDLHYEENDYWPLVFFHITGGDPMLQKECECELVTELVKVLRNVCGKNMDSKEFWYGGDTNDGVLGILSPHHEHIEKLKNDIIQNTGVCREDLFIDTVDKLQGQQRDAIIVSYGVTDVESAAVESEFIFNRNRLNVSLTRGKAKTIVLFSDTLTKCSPELLSVDDENVQKGVDFVCGLLPFMQREENDTVVSKKHFDYSIKGVTLGVDIYRKRVK